MNPIAVVCRKEIVDNVRDRRTMFSTLAFGPIFAPLMFVVMMQIVVDRTVSAVEQALSVPIVGIEMAPNLEAYLVARGITADTGHGISDIDTAAAAVAAGEQGYVVVIEDSFADNLGSEQSARITVVLDRSDSRDSERIAAHYRRADLRE